jgi:hypothetical protein
MPDDPIAIAIFINPNETPNAAAPRAFTGPLGGGAGASTRAAPPSAIAAANASAFSRAARIFRRNRPSLTSATTASANPAAMAVPVAVSSRASIPAPARPAPLSPAIHAPSGPPLPRGAPFVSAHNCGHTSAHTNAAVIAGTSSITVRQNRLFAHTFSSSLSGIPGGQWTGAIA